MLDKKIEYSNVMSSLNQKDRESMWGKEAYLYRDLYIDKEDDRAFNSEEEVDKAIKKATDEFKKEFLKSDSTDC